MIEMFMTNLVNDSFSGLKLTESEPGLLLQLSSFSESVAFSQIPLSDRRAQMKDSAVKAHPLEKAHFNWDVYLFTILFGLLCLSYLL